MDGISNNLHASSAKALETASLRDPVHLPGKPSTDAEPSAFLPADEPKSPKTSSDNAAEQNSADERVASLMPSISTRNSGSKLSATQFRLQCPADIGNYLGLTVETVSRYSVACKNRISCVSITRKSRY